MRTDLPDAGGEDQAIPQVLVQVEIEEKQKPLVNAGLFVFGPLANWRIYFKMFN
jgi:hypothetical protein